MQPADDLRSSQKSPPPPITLDPIPATTIASNETHRRNANLTLGLCKTGCPEIDDYVLQGGLERGSVVGVSTEREDFGIALSIQLLSQGLKDGTLKRALVITPRPKMEILCPLRSALSEDALGKVDIAQVFDIDGVWEVLADLDRGVEPSPEPEPTMGVEASREIEDSQDEDELPSPVNEDTKGVGGKGDERGSHPDLIITTHFSSLLTSLFTIRPPSTAHPLLQALSSHTRHLTRTLPSSPLIIILNSTASDDSKSNDTNKPLDPTLSSIFNPPIIPGLPSHGARRNKPSFGMVFSQMLDVHLLCTGLPKTGRDADEQLVRGGGETVMVVEVLLDELGVWEGGERRRRFREQRWGAVDVREGRVVDAFEKGARKQYGEIRLAAGFGGPRV